jgi:hypothetical protein
MQGQFQEIPGNRKVAPGIPDQVNRKTRTLPTERNRDMKPPRNLRVRPAAKLKAVPHTV